MISPCVKKCNLDHKQFCTGCKRHVMEIAQWTHYTDAQRKQILEELKHR